MGKQRSLCYYKDFVFVSADGQTSQSLKWAVFWNTIEGMFVQVVYRNRYIGLLNYQGTVPSADKLPDFTVYGEVFYVKDEDCFYINIPDEPGMLEKFPLVTVGV